MARTPVAVRPMGRTVLSLKRMALPSREAMIISQPQLKLDLSGLWDDAGHLYMGIEYDYWHNKYGIAGLEDSVVLPFLLWTF